MPCSSLLPLCPIFARILAYPRPTLSPSSITPLRPEANGSVIPIPLAQRRRPLATGKEDRARPILFPVASASGRRYTRGDGCGPGEAFGTNVDSLHILAGAGRPPNVPLASQALERVRILPHATRRAAAAGGTPGRATPPARASLLMTVSRSPHFGLGHMTVDILGKATFRIKDKPTYQKGLTCVSQ